MDILIIGSGGREHALAWKVAQSRRVHNVFVAPGNAGTAGERGVINIDLAVTDLDALMQFARERDIALTIVGPEQPLSMGIVDQFRAAGLPCFGPTEAAAQLESSKAFSKAFMQRHGIPTAAYQSFEQLEPALAFIDSLSLPMVIKADGLAAGKGVIIAQTREEAVDAARDMLEGNAFGEAGHRIIVEEFLSGEEASFICLCGEHQYVPLASSQDHKAALDGDRGDNTGGMGAISPSPLVDAAMHRKILEQVIEPTLEGMRQDGHPFTGFLYAGLMISPEGELSVLEFNVRFGDPETQPVLMRLESDLVSLCLSALEGSLDQREVHWTEQAAVGVVMAAKGYPKSYPSGDVITGLAAVAGEGGHVFHAGTREEGEHIVTAGGRVLCVTALGDDLHDARARAYHAVGQIRFDGAHYRTDIGDKAIAHL